MSEEAGKGSSKDARLRVLSAVREALGDIGDRRVELPVSTFSESSQDKHELARIFAGELAALAGLAVVVRDRNECASSLAAFLQERGARSVAFQSTPLATDIASRLHGIDVWAAVGSDKHELARVDCALLEARALVADAGAACVVLDNASDRVLPYLPRTCALVAELASLHATLSLAALTCIQDAANARSRGEALIVAGPSRTADIEKILVLGAHGPQAVAVFIIEQPGDLDERNLEATDLQVR
ncbi:MAG: lactate utilization protein [Candidatus Eremiobacteraeota bacterium]|nr:lactate utilization protein [Candidatus Eremiobacteraeota bacterium]